MNSITCVTNKEFFEQLEIWVYTTSNKLSANVYIAPFAKIFEQLIHDKLEAFFTKNKILSTQQYGFRKNTPPAWLYQIY